jgi:hypothetical protein
MEWGKHQHSTYYSVNGNRMFAIQYKVWLRIMAKTPITPCLEKVTKLSSVISFMMGKCVISNVSLLVLIRFYKQRTKRTKGSLKIGNGCG